MAIALITPNLPGYRIPLYELLAKRDGVEVLCYGRGERYIPSWFRDLDEQLASARFPARQLQGAPRAFAAARRYDAVIAPFAGGAILPAAYAGARAGGRPFVLWASVWAQPRSVSHALALPVTRHVYRHADAVIAYGEHVRRFVARIRGRDDDIFIAPQTVEPQLFARPVSEAETQRFRREHDLGEVPTVLHVGRLIPEKGVGLLLDGWERLRTRATLVLIGDGPLAERARATAGVRLLGAMSREQLPAAYAASEMVVLASIPTPRFREPWGLVCNEAMHQARPVIASDSVGAVAGGLVRHGETGLVIASGDVGALVEATERLLDDPALRTRLGEAGRRAVSPYTYEAMADAFERALATASTSLPARGSPRSTRWPIRRRT